MPISSPLGSQNIMAFAATQDPVKAKTFYRDVLGLRLTHEDGFALAFDANGIMLRVTTVEKVAVAPYTILGWQVDDIVAVIAALQARDVKFERYPGLSQDELGIWTAPGGAKIAWFKDPDRNTLSVTEL